MERALPQDSAGAGRQAPRRKTKARLAFFKAVEHTCRLLGGRHFYRSQFLKAGRFHERVEELHVPGLPAGLEGFTIAHLSDMHAGSFLAQGDLADVVQRVNELQVDAVALTGDYITDHPREALLLTEDLGRLRSRFGSFAVFGNHDYRDRREAEIVRAYGDIGIRFLRNRGERLDTGRGVLAITGVEDLEEAKVIHCEAARADLRADDVEVLLCHNPAGAEAFARPACVAVLSGHTHGRQIDLPWLRNLGPHHPGLRRQFGQTTSIVSRGLGVIGVPFRYGSPAELVLVKLKRAEAN